MTKGEVTSAILSSPAQGMTVPLDETGSFRVVSNQAGKELVKIDESLAHFADGKFQIENTKGYVGINTTPYASGSCTGIALLIKPVEGDRGLAILRPSVEAGNYLLEFQDESHDIQGLAFDFNGRPVAVGAPPNVAPGEQVSYANPHIQVRDVAGSVTAAVRHDPTAPGTVAKVTFSRPYASVPLGITINDHSDTASDLYVSARSEKGFTVSTRKALRAGSILNFDYAVIA